jgi:hypothetical protein
MGGMAGEEDKVSEETRKDGEQRLRHFQTINSSNVTNTINIVLTLAVGVSAFAVNILVSARGPLGTGAAVWLITSLGLLFASILTGIVAMLNRIEDFRLTIESIVLVRDNPPFVTDPKMIEVAKNLKKNADRVNATTRVLLKLQPILFGLGFIAVAISVILTNGNKLFG